MTGKHKAGLIALVALVVLAVIVYWPSGGPDPKSPDMDERLEAVKELVGCTDEASLRTLGELAHDSEVRVARAAVRAIGRGRGELNSGALKDILKAKDCSGAVRGMAAAALGKFKTTDFHLLVDILDNRQESREARAGAAKGLGHLHNIAAIDSLVKALTDPDAHVRHNAFEAIGKTAGLYFEFNPAARPGTQTRNLAEIRRQLAGRGARHTHGR